MPLGLIIQPFHQLHETEGVVPIVDIFKDKIIRCDNCQTYINPFFKFNSTYTQFGCNHCDFVTKTDIKYAELIQNE